MGRVYFGKTRAIESQYGFIWPAARIKVIFVPLNVIINAGLLDRRYAAKPPYLAGIKPPRRTQGLFYFYKNK